MGDPRANGAPAAARQPPRARWWSSSRTDALALALGAVLLEALPVSIVLQTAAAVLVGDPGQAALPLWYIVAIVIVAWLLGRSLRRLGLAAILPAILVLLAALTALAWRISVAAYGSVAGGPLDFGWVGTLGSDLLAGSPRIGRMLALLVLTAYLVWRGVQVGHTRATLDTLRPRFAYSLTAVIAAAALAGFMPEPGKPLLVGRLAVLLPLEMFVGLVTLALARTGDGAEGRAGAEGWMGTRRQRPWLLLAVALAGMLLGVSLLLSLIVSYDNLLAALNALGPIGAALSQGIEWLAYGVAYLLNFLFGWLFDLLNSWVGRFWQVNRPRPQPPSQGTCPPTRCPHAVPPATGIAVAIVLAVLILAVLVVLAYFIYRAIRLVRRREEDPEALEERESLDGRALLGAQLRDFFGGLRRRGAAGGEEALRAGSVRWVYREVLRAAAAVGLGRLPTETPDEYARRLGAALAAESVPAPRGDAGRVAAESDVAALTSAYNQARYGEVEPEEGRPGEVRRLGERLVGWLRRLRPAG